MGLWPPEWPLVGQGASSRVVVRSVVWAVGVTSSEEGPRE